MILEHGTQPEPISSLNHTHKWWLAWKKQSKTSREDIDSWWTWNLLLSGEYVAL